MTNTPTSIIQEAPVHMNASGSTSAVSSALSSAPQAGSATADAHAGVQSVAGHAGLRRITPTTPAADATQAQDTRQRLVEAATNLFWEKGYAATGLSEILKEAGARAGSLYHFFPAKEQLLLAVLDQHQVILETAVLRAGELETDPVKRALAIMTFYREFMVRTGFALGCPMVNLAGEVSDSHPQARERIAALFEIMRKGVVLALTTGRDPLAVSQGERLSVLLICALQGAIVQSRAARSPAAIDTCIEQLGSLLRAAREVR